MSGSERTALQVQTAIHLTVGNAEERSTKDLSLVQDTRTLIRGSEKTREGGTRPANPRFPE